MNIEYVLYVATQPAITTKREHVKQAYVFLSVLLHLRKITCTSEALRTKSSCGHVNFLNHSHLPDKSRKAAHVHCGSCLVTLNMLPWFKVKRDADFVKRCSGQARLRRFLW
jgi:hypothetical protein